MKILNNWIPCSERLPEHKQMCLLQAKCNNRMYVSFWFEDKNSHHWRCIISRGSAVTGLIPIVWMPLPEPYEEN